MTDDSEITPLQERERKALQELRHSCGVFNAGAMLPVELLHCAHRLVGHLAEEDLRHILGLVSHRRLRWLSQAVRGLSADESQPPDGVYRVAYVTPHGAADESAMTLPLAFVQLVKQQVDELLHPGQD